MNGTQDFNCLICSDLAHNAMETLCCGQLMCQQCVQDVKAKFRECPNCRDLLECKPSMISRRMISGFKVECKYQCGIKVPYKEKEQHQAICKNRSMTCKICKKTALVESICSHMLEEHPQELTKLCVAFHETQMEPTCLLKKKSSAVNSLSSNQSSFKLSNKIKNENGDISQFGTTGKYYCGKKNLIGKCNCCNGHCGPTNGQNCDACMALDLKKFSLSKGFLVNSSGVVCKLDREKKTYYCGRRYQQGFNGYGQRFCEPSNPCRPCACTLNGVRLGRYSKLI